MWHLAFQHLINRKRQTIITTGGLFLGTSAFVMVSGYTIGLEDFFKDRLLNNDAQLRVSAKEEFITPEKNGVYLFGTKPTRWSSPPSGRKDNARIVNPKGWLKRFSQDPRIEAYTPQFVTQAILTKGAGRASATIFGVHPSEQALIAPRIARSMTEGRFKDLEVGGNRIVLGAGLRKKLGLQLGDTIQASVGLSSVVPFKIVGFFQIGLDEPDRTNAYANIADVQKLAGAPSQVNEIGVRLYDRDLAPEVAQGYAALGQDKVRSWKEINETFVAIIGIQTALRFLVVGVLTIVVSFGIFNVLNISVSQKKKDIAILRSMGFSQSQVVRLFLYQGLLMAIVGGSGGLVLGYLICRFLATIKFSEASGNLNISFLPSIYVGSFLVAIGAAAFSSFLPARQAGKLQPIKVIREGSD